jgi:hypothetical protein
VFGVRRPRGCTRWSPIVASIAIIGSLFISPAAPRAGAELRDGMTVSPTAGTNATPLTLALTPPDDLCPGSTIQGYRWHQFIASSEVDPATIERVGGTLIDPSSRWFVAPLYSTSGIAQFDRTVPNGTNRIENVQPIDLAQSTLVGSGSYSIGFLCTLGRSTVRHWSTTITISFSGPTTFDWSIGPPQFGDVVLTSLSAGLFRIDGSFTAAPSFPPVHGYVITLSAVPPDGVINLFSVSTPGPFSLTGLSNGRTYSVTVAARIGSLSGPPTALATIAVPGFAGPVASTTSETGKVTFEWLPAQGQVDRYVVYETSGRIPAFSVAGTTTSVEFTSQQLGGCGVALTFGVYATYALGFGSPVSQATGAALCEQVLVQDIRLVRPAGALVLTQRCGVFGSAPAHDDPLFRNLPALPAEPANADELGVLPIGSAPTVGAGGVSDPLFPQYPYPVDLSGIPTATYPTDCAVDLGTGSLVTSGPRAGQYFVATGRLAQITVVDTRDGDGGWTLNGTMSEFESTTDSTDRFSGNLLGWIPEVTWDSDATLDGYDMTVTAGGRRDPEPSASTTGLGAASNSTNTSVASSLAQAGVGRGLGQAVIDARLRLAVPVTADAGTYRGTLTFTVV